MSRSFKIMAIASILFSGITCAANDIPATLSISGTVSEGQFSCGVLLDESSVSLIQDSDTLIKQGDNATTPTLVKITINGGDANGGGNLCNDLITEGKIAYKFTGTADNADGTSLANTLSDQTAAQGVGIGIFDDQNKPIAANTGLVLAKEEVTTIGLQMVQLHNQTPVAGNINSTVTVQIERL